MPMQTKVAGAWKNVNPQVKVAGAWKAVQRGFVKVAGVWEQFYTAVSQALSDATYDTKSLTFSSDYGLASFTIKPDGTKLYLLYTDQSATNVLEMKQYTMSTAWDISTATLDKTENIDLSPATEEEAQSVRFRPNGEQAYIAFADVSTFLDLSTAWDIATQSYTNSNPDNHQGTGLVESIFLKDDGTKLYGVQDSIIYQYTVDTAWNTNAITYDSVSFDASAEIADIKSIYISSDGLTLYAVGFGSSSVHQYSFDTAWDLSTLSYDGVTFDPSETGVLVGIWFKPDRRKMYLLDPNAFEIFQYSVPEF